MKKYRLLEDVCEILDSQRIPITASERKAGGYPYYGANGIQDYVDNYIFDDDLVLLAEDGGNFGSRDKPIAYRVSGKCWVNNHAHVLKPKSTINVDYLCYTLMFYDTTGLVNGATRQKLTQSAMRQMKIPFVKMDVQNKIVKKINLVVDLIGKRKKQLEKLDELVKSRFIEMFGGIHDSKMYPYKTVKELTEVISGGTPSRDVSEYWEEGTIPWVKTTELHNNVVTKVEEYITEKGLNNSSAKIVPVGTVLVAMYGQGKTRGMTAYLEIKACTNQACACILPSDKINQKFLWYFFILSYDNLRDLAKGGNQPNLNGNMIKTYPILYPPIELQNQFAAFVKQVDKSKFEIKQSLEKLELLKKSLMQKYFG